jgi:hypothetical protein
MRKSFVALAAVALTAVTAFVLAAPANAGVRAGILRCTVEPGVSMIVGSKKAVSCEFKSTRGHREHYRGYITRIGLDVGFTTGGKIAWAVYAPSRRVRGALAGVYGGASAEATVSGGVGANVLIGGFEHSITLQPLSIGSQTGFDLAVAVSGLKLVSVR